MVSARLRRAGASTHTPVTGASNATTSPAAANARPSQLAGLVSPGRSSPTAEVRYTVKTNVMTIALIAVAPKSHIAHASTRDLLAVPAGGPVVGASSLMDAHDCSWVPTI